MAVPCPQNSAGPGGPGDDRCTCSVGFFAVGGGGPKLNAKTNKFNTDGCKACTDVANKKTGATLKCTNSSDTTVSACADGYRLASDSKSCLPDCADGYYIVKQKGKKFLSEVDIKFWLQDKIPKYKLPKRIFFWENLTKTSYGKVAKNQIKKEFFAKNNL